MIHYKLKCLSDYCFPDGIRLGISNGGRLIKAALAQVSEFGSRPMSIDFCHYSIVLESDGMKKKGWKSMLAQILPLSRHFFDNEMHSKKEKRT